MVSSALLRPAGLRSARSVGVVQRALLGLASVHTEARIKCVRPSPAPAVQAANPSPSTHPTLHQPTSTHRSFTTQSSHASPPSPRAMERAATT
eukprot:scaffold77599_cov33-Tisochrysis_lutea.AAC.1